MPASLSMDLRERIVATYEQEGGSCRLVATRFGVSPGSVSKLVRQSRTEGCLKPRYERCGRKRSIWGKTEEALKKHVREYPDATLQERKDTLDPKCTIKTVWVSLKRLNARFKKVTASGRAGSRRRRSQTR